MRFDIWVMEQEENLQGLVEPARGVLTADMT